MKIILMSLCMVLLTACSSSTEQKHDFEKIAKACEEKGGRWHEEWSECAINEKNWCEEMGGQLDTCASSCSAHGEKDPGPCILKCNTRCYWK
ncbi:hypothetical protein GF376_01505 [Candidatus Peregrinibacteria bacterium]|nr:hypothetical protein [Candidatus Peregrinibacteria bacterium]